MILIIIKYSYIYLLLFSFLNKCFGYKNDGEMRSNTKFSMIPPTFKELIEISYNYIINDIVTINGNIVEIDIVLRVIWTDHWSKINEAPDLNYSLFKTNEIWHPKIEFTSSDGYINFFTDDIDIVIHSNRTAEVEIVKRVKVLCKDIHNHRYFPNDILNCHIEFLIKLLSNFSIKKYDSETVPCNKDQYFVELWYSNCNEFVENFKVKKPINHWPLLSLNDNNQLHIGNISGQLLLRRLLESRNVFQPVWVWVCSQILFLICPNQHSFVASILSQLFLSLALHITNFKNSFSTIKRIDDGHTRFELAGFMNTAYAFSALNLVITIICSTDAINKVSATDALDSFINLLRNCVCSTLYRCVADIINKCKSNKCLFCSKQGCFCRWFIIVIFYFIQYSNWILWFIIMLYFPLLLVYERWIWQGAIMLGFIIVFIAITSMLIIVYHQNRYERIRS